MPNGKPNIVVIWGDDVGITNLSAVPAAQKAATFTVDQALEMLTDALKPGA